MAAFDNDNIISRKTAILIKDKKLNWSQWLVHSSGHILRVSLKATWSIIKDERRIDHALRDHEYRANDKDESGTEYATLSAEKTQ